MRLPVADSMVTLNTDWAAMARSLGMAAFMLPEDGFSTILRPDTLPEPMPRRVTGLYFWLAENGEAYVGQAVDVQSRLRQHLRVHPDIRCAAFRPVSRERLDIEERSAAQKAETGFSLRNIKLVKQTATYRPLDVMVDASDQVFFLRHGNRPEWAQEPRQAFPLLQVRTRPAYRRFHADGPRSQALRAILRVLVLALVPRPWTTEARFWSMSWIGAGAARLNVGQQELATVELADTQEGIVRLLAPKRLSWFAGRSRYETGDFENRLSLGKAMRLVRDRMELRPVRERALWLARHTTPLNLRSHCPWLLDAEVTA